MRVDVDDAGYLERLRAGDEAAYKELVTTYQGVLFGVARRVLRDPEEARDAVQDAFLSVLFKQPPDETVIKNYFSQFVRVNGTLVRIGNLTSRLNEHGVR